MIRFDIFDINVRQHWEDSVRSFIPVFLLPYMQSIIDERSLDLAELMVGEGHLRMNCRRKVNSQAVIICCVIDRNNKTDHRFIVNEA